MRNVVLFCTGLSGSGKTYFINNLPSGLFYNLRSLTTRGQRAGEVDGEKYFFVDEARFETEKLVTKLWVNQDFWSPGKPKWMYGVPESEIYNNPCCNFVYDVIQPRYVRQMIDWFHSANLTTKYNFYIAWFLPPRENNIVAARANMPDDTNVRKQNTCNLQDFLNANLHVDFMLRPRDGQPDPRLEKFIETLYNDKLIRPGNSDSDKHCSR